MRLTYDKHGICTRCGLPGSGFVSEGVCECGDEQVRRARPLTIDEALELFFTRSRVIRSEAIRVQ